MTNAFNITKKGTYPPCGRGWGVRVSEVPLSCILLVYRDVPPGISFAKFVYQGKNKKFHTSIKPHNTRLVLKELHLINWDYKSPISPTHA